MLGACMLGACMLGGRTLGGRTLGCQRDFVMARVGDMSGGCVIMPSRSARGGIERRLAHEAGRLAMIDHATT